MCAYMDVTFGRGGEMTMGTNTPSRQNRREMKHLHTLKLRKEKENEIGSRNSSPHGMVVFKKLCDWRKSSDEKNDTSMFLNFFLISLYQIKIDSRKISGTRCLTTCQKPNLSFHMSGDSIP